MKAFVIRDATSADISALADLHVKTFKETHGNGPTREVRHWQYHKAFAETDGSWFCFVAENPACELMGFAVGVPYDRTDLPYSGELNEIYVLREYHRQGVGRQLLGHVARRFLSRGISSMLLFGDARSPSNGFYEALGAERLVAEDGEFHGGYGWRDLHTLASMCPIE
jgi:GNAT superfamily N-acetyltransferase